MIFFQPTVEMNFVGLKRNTDSSGGPFNCINIC